MATLSRQEFTRLVEEALDSMPRRFRERIENVAVLVEDEPPEQATRRIRKLPAPRSARPRKLVLGRFIGVPTTERSFFGLPPGPAYVVLYQKNIEAVCSTKEEIREQVRLTVFHELGHYFGMDESQLWDV
ncbi:MAG: metallopeptidase family protein [Candidatus Korobacteraceae bacterium]